MKGITKADILKVRKTAGQDQQDALVLEEPLEIRLGFEKEGIRHQKSISVTMRTPGDDEELALGFLFTEGILSSLSQIQNISRAATRWPEAKENVIVIELNGHQELNFKRLERHFYTTSSCGVCGKASIEAIRVQGRFEIPDNTPQVEAALLHTLPGQLLRHQSVFDCTGGLHAAALFDKQGRLLMAREDIGRHNALDKLIGAAWQQDMLPLQDHLILVSGRAGFELVQKSVVAGAPLFAAVGAPSSLAVELATEAGMTLIGFLRNEQFNIYTHPERVILQSGL
ncbi:MAG: formate dehydrogenase accessory sulfurtransferase FdhD [Saprospiraceae bacterium]|nr:MAG: formate dehydrogenase accessory sulfurtransferase FdhD [Saprospiraceae bacterium]